MAASADFLPSTFNPQPLPDFSLSASPLRQSASRRRVSFQDFSFSAFQHFPLGLSQPAELILGWKHLWPRRRRKTHGRQRQFLPRHPFPLQAARQPRARAGAAGAFELATEMRRVCVMKQPGNDRRAVPLRQPRFGLRQAQLHEPAFGRTIQLTTAEAAKLAHGDATAAGDPGDTIMAIPGQRRPMRYSGEPPRNTIRSHLL
jgi:hypothetical protein